MSNPRLNLPQTSVALRRQTNAESTVVKAWEKSQQYSDDSLASADFHLMDGPPYANGEPHLGHLLNKVLKDFVVRSQNLLGQTTAFKPGWDCHGLPLELAVEKKYGKLSPQESNNRSAKLAMRSVVRGRKAFKLAGVKAAWDSPYLTLSPELRRHTYTTLKTLFNKNLLQYKKNPVHVCGACRSSLSDAELESAETNKDSLYFLVDLVGKHESKPVRALVWTTTPWTVPMNQGLAYSPDTDYQQAEFNDFFVVGQNLSDVSFPEKWGDVLAETTVNSSEFVKMFDGCQSPVQKQFKKLMPADFVTAGKTGFVHVVPAHGLDDFKLGKVHALSEFTFVANDGMFYGLPEQLSGLTGKHVGNAHTVVVPMLTEANALVSYSRSKADAPHCWRHKQPVFHLATYQVFLDLVPLKQNVKSTLDQTSMSEKDKELLGKMMMSRPDWCLSRQRHWGNRLALWVDSEHNLLPECSDYLQALADNNESLVAEMNQKLFAAGHRRVDDVLDVWFDSGNLGVAYFNEFGKVPDLVLEGRDQFRGWFQSLMWLSMACHEQPAFKNMLWHGFVLDKEKQKLAKSKGNAGTLQSYFSEFGSDVMRLWVAQSTFGQDASFSKDKLNEMKAFYNRFRLTLRYAASNLYDYSSDTAKLLVELNDSPHLNGAANMAQAMLAETMSTEDLVKKNFASFSFREAAENLYTFCEVRLSNFYFDALKSLLYLDAPDSQDRRYVQAALSVVLSKLSALLEVFCPFLVEEVRTELPVLVDTPARQKNFDISEVEVAKSFITGFAPKGAKVDYALVLSDVHKKNRFSDSDLARFGGVSSLSYVKTNTHLVCLKDDPGYGKCSRCWNYVLLNSLKDGCCC